MSADPLDIATIRATAERACSINGAPADDLRFLASALRGQLALLVPEVREMARHRSTEQAAVVALVGAEEAERRAGALWPGVNERTVRKSAMAVLALCRHYENVSRAAAVAFPPV
ncbi:DUF6415 family natural product biosynthesis protein [Streptomyces sp. NPDC059166]|uniref:DUF6415 family natural product biosynthesis protein n=1 Tax=Streptomyces sp. NPDC059166 TaxID=3346752 RepID=UPI00367DB7FC